MDDSLTHHDLTFIILFIHNCIIVISTGVLLKEARKVVRGTDDSLRWCGIMIVVLTATVYTLSILPITVYLTAESFVAQEDLMPGPGKFHINKMKPLYLSGLAEKCTCASRAYFQQFRLIPVFPCVFLW